MKTQNISYKDRDLIVFYIVSEFYYSPAVYVWLSFWRVIIIAPKKWTSIIILADDLLIVLDIFSTVRGREQNKYVFFPHSIRRTVNAARRRTQKSVTRTIRIGTSRTLHAEADDVPPPHNRYATVSQESDGANNTATR